MPSPAPPAALSPFPPVFPPCSRTALIRRISELLGLARRAGQAVVGFEKAREWLRTGRGRLVLQASDGSLEGRARFLSRREDGPVADPLSARALGAVFGRDHVVHVAVAPGRLAASASRRSDFGSCGEPPVAARAAVTPVNDRWGRGQQESMSETNDHDTGKGRLSLRPAGRLELGRTVDAGSVRQSFSHGRSKVVQVEVRKKRAPGAPPSPRRARPDPGAPAPPGAAPGRRAGAPARRPRRPRADRDRTGRAPRALASSRARPRGASRSAASRKRSPSCPPPRKRGAARRKPRAPPRKRPAARKPRTRKQAEEEAARAAAELAAAAQSTAPSGTPRGRRSSGAPRDRHARRSPGRAGHPRRDAAAQAQHASPREEDDEAPRRRPGIVLPGRKPAVAVPKKVGDDRRRAGRIDVQAAIEGEDEKSAASPRSAASASASGVRPSSKCCAATR